MGNVNKIIWSIASLIWIIGGLVATFKGLLIHGVLAIIAGHTATAIVLLFDISENTTKEKRK